MVGPSARLHLLGGAWLEGDEGPVGGRGAQRRRIALLALLATARHPVSRDKLIAYLWEDADTERARKLLSESLYVIRKAIGEDAITASGDALELNRGVIWSDTAAFAAAFERLDYDTAIALYAGPFLDGFFINDAVEFDHWVETERADLARLRAAALTRLADAAELRGDFATAARHWRTLVEQDRYNSGYALGLMRMLDASGDRAGALQHARIHAALLRSEFEAEPDPAVAALAQALQVAPDAHAQTPRSSGADSPERHVNTDVLAVPYAASVPPVAQQPPARGRWMQHLGIVAPVILLAISSIVVFRITRPAARPAAASTASVVAVLPFTVHGPAPELRDGLAHLLSTNLDGAADLRSVDSHAVLGVTADDEGAIAPDRARIIAARFAAGYYVLGDATRAGSQLQIAATLYRAAAGTPIVRAVARGPADSLLALVDQIATQLVATRGGSAPEVTQLAIATTRSYSALKHYLAGEREYRAGRYGAAAVAFQHALHEDRDFALAAYRLSAAAEWDFDFRTARKAAQLALANSARLPESYQPLARGWSYFLSGNADGAQRTYESILNLHASSVEARSGLAEVLVHFNGARGLPLDPARDAFARVLDVAPAYGEVRHHLLEFAARDRDLTRFDSLIADLEVTNPQYLSWRAVHAFTWGTAADRARARRDLAQADELAIGIAAARLAAHTNNFAAARSVAEELARPDRTNDWRAGGHLLIAEIEMARGRPIQAQRALAAALATERDWPVELAALFSLHPSASATRDDLERQRAALLAWAPGSHSPSTTFFLAAHAAIHEHLRLYLLALVAARLGELDAAHSYRRQLEQLARGSEAQLALALSRSIAGHIARARGERAQAVRLLMTATIEAPPEFVLLSPFYSRAHDRFVLAETQHELGNYNEARRWYESLAHGNDFLYAQVARARLRTLQ